MSRFRTEIIGAATLILGDCREVLPTLGRFDAVVTDPPYGVDGGVGGNARRGKAEYTAAFSDDEAYIRLVCVPAFEAALAISSRGSITPGTRCSSFYPRPRDMGCLWTPAGAGCGPWGFVTFHPILFYGRDPRAGLGALPSGRLMRPSNEETFAHPCVKPLADWRWLVAKTSLPGEDVLDPFMGSGTTGVACMNLGRAFTGIEIHEPYFDIACRRIETAWKQPRLFDEPKPKPIQETLDLPASCAKSPDPALRRPTEPEPA